MGSLPKDFKSFASADFAILAYLCIIIQFLFNAKDFKSLASACFAIPARNREIITKPCPVVKRVAGEGKGDGEFLASARHIGCGARRRFYRNSTKFYRGYLTAAGRRRTIKEN